MKEIIWRLKRAWDALRGSVPDMSKARLSVSVQSRKIEKTMRVTRHDRMFGSWPRKDKIEWEIAHDIVKEAVKANMVEFTYWENPENGDVEITGRLFIHQRP